MKRPPLSARDRRIISMYKAKLSCPQIGEQLGINASTVAKVVRDHGLTRPNGWAAKPVAANKARNDRIIKLYREGLTAEQVSERIGNKMTPSGVLYVLKSRGVARRQSGSWVPPRPKNFYKVRDFALKVQDQIGRGPESSAAAIARKNGISVEEFRAHLRRLGIKARLGMGAARLGLEDVARIRKILVTTKRTLTSIAEEFGVDGRTISSIAMGHTWTDVPWPKGKRYVRRAPARRAGRKATERGARAEPQRAGKRRSTRK
jgi:DNA-binding CsgD family transcriptional regulator